jgi:beta-glucosidase
MNPAVPHLSLTQKAEAVSGASFWNTRPIEAAGLPEVVLSDGPHGVRLQRATGDHLGVFDSEPATSFPTAAATGSTWDPELLEEMGRALGRESRVLGVDVLLGPGVNIKRSPLCGRNFEYFSEDPLLSGALGSAWVRGVQSQGVGASVKHFAANNQETDRMRVSAEVDERSLREIYFPAFERIVRDAAPATVMCSYNKINGVYSSQNRWLLTDVLRGDWGFQGYVVSDWGAVVDPVAAVAAGLDLAMPGTGDAGPAAVAAAVRSGALDEALLDQAVSRVIGVHEQLLASREDTTVDLAAHHSLARRVAAASSVLLKNDGGILPLSPTTGGAIAVVGEFARSPRYQGAGSSHINPTRLDDALSAITAATDREVGFAAGFSLDGKDDADLRAEAVALASESDVVVLFLGLADAEESEGFDREHLDLPPVQLRLAAEIAAVNPRVVAVLSNGGVVVLDGLTETVPAILENWLGGQATGSATADIVFGAVEPGGRLAETIPHALRHTPAHVNWPGNEGVVRYGEGVYVGYRWYDATDRDVAFPFGFGLGYTTFAYSDLSVSVPDPTRAEAIVEVTVKNTGTRAGSDVVQIYVTDVDASVDRPEKELKGFEKVHLAPGEHRRVRITLDERAFAFWGVTGWTVEPGEFRIAVGPHSHELPLIAPVRLDVPAPVRTLDAQSTVDDWIGHPTGSIVLAGLLEQMGPAAQAMTGSELIKMIGSMPLKTLLAFGAEGATEPVDADALIDQLLAQVSAEPVSAG